jgi:hypothetical protein
VPVRGVIDVVRRGVPTCWKCGSPGHYARDCPTARDCPKHWPDHPKEAGAGVQCSAPLNMLSVHESSQDHHILITSIQHQVTLQHQLLET